MNLFPTYRAFHNAHLGSSVGVWCRCDACAFEGVADVFIEDGYDHDDESPLYRCTCGGYATAKVQPSFDWLLWIVNGAEYFDDLGARDRAAAARRPTWN